MLIWALVVLGPVENREELLKYLLRLVQKGPQIKLVLYIVRDPDLLLCFGQPTLATLDALAHVLEWEPSTKPDFRIYSSLVWSANLRHWISVVANGKPYSLHVCLAGGKQPIPFTKLHKALRLDNPLIKSVYLDFEFNYLFVAPKLFEGPLSLGNLEIPVQGFSTLRETPIPTQIPVYNVHVIREDFGIPSPCLFPKKPVALPILEYGATEVPVTRELSMRLKTPTAAETRLEICGFVDVPLPHQRGAGATLIRAADVRNQAFTVLVAGMAQQRKSAVLRFQKQGTHVEMMSLNVVGTSTVPESLYLVMEPLPFAQECPAPLQQFPPLAKQPRHETFDALIDSLEDIDCSDIITNTPLGTAGMAANRLNHSNAASSLSMKNPLANRIYDLALQKAKIAVSNARGSPYAQHVHVLFVIESKSFKFTSVNAQFVVELFASESPFQPVEICVLKTESNGTYVQHHSHESQFFMLDMVGKPVRYSIDPMNFRPGVPQRSLEIMCSFHHIFDRIKVDYYQIHVVAEDSYETRHLMSSLGLFQEYSEVFFHGYDEGIFRLDEGWGGL